MASTRSVLRASAQRLVEPGVVLESVNEQLCLDMPPNMFVTCLYGVLELSTGRFVFANAGHNLPVVRKVDGNTDEPRATGMPLGLLPGMRYDEVTVTIELGQSVVLYSDALPEAHDADREMFGFGSVSAAVGRVEDGSMIDALMAELEQFTGADWEQEDDITIVTMRRGGVEVAGAEVGAMFLGDEGEQQELGELVAAFTVPSEPGNEKIVMERVATIASSKAGLDPARLDRLKTAVAETVMNAIEHGNNNQSELSVEVAVFAGVHALVVRIRDHGGGAEVPEATDPDIDAKLRGEQSPRGWGLFLIRHMVDDVQVTIDDEHHTVDLVVKTDRSDA
jgi:anti-sigma regulatory factor (Ser/Thr protein kinase)